MSICIRNGQNFLIDFWSLLFHESEWNSEVWQLKWKCFGWRFLFLWVQNRFTSVSIFSRATFSLFSFENRLKCSFWRFFFSRISRFYRKTKKCHSLFCYENKYTYNLHFLRWSLTSEMNQILRCFDGKIPYSSLKTLTLLLFLLSWKNEKSCSIFLMKICIPINCMR